MAGPGFGSFNRSGILGKRLLLATCIKIIGSTSPVFSFRAIRGQPYGQAKPKPARTGIAEQQAIRFIATRRNRSIGMWKNSSALTPELF
jgi:hypothetical protein